MILSDGSDNYSSLNNYSYSNFNYIKKSGQFYNLYRFHRPKFSQQGNDTHYQQTNSQRLLPDTKHLPLEVHHAEVSACR